MPNSRLARHEQQKLLRQTVLFGVGAVVIIALFLFVVLPTFVRLVVGLGGQSSPNLSGDTVAPALPTLATLPDATPSASLKLKGFAEAKSTVIVVLNGQEGGQITAGDDGAFELNVDLEDGDNTIAIFARDAADNESATTQAVIITRDSAPPKLEIAEPTDGQQIELRRNQMTSIKGTTDPGSQVTLNGRRLFPNQEGAFSSTFQLGEGENKLEFVATDEAGNQTSKILTVNFRL